MAHGVLYFGDCSINIASRELLRAGERVNLPPVVFDCIAYLIQHRERAVGRDELVAAVWGKTSVSDAVMGKTILTARRAVGDTAEEQRFLRTVPRFGYQWGAPTRGEPAESPSSSAESGMNPATPSSPMAATPTRPRTRPMARFVSIGAALAALIVVFAGVSQWRREATTPMPASSKLAPAAPADIVIVLPAEVLASSEDSWLRLGLMDLVATRLRAAGLAVLPSDNVVRLVPADTTRTVAIASARAIAGRAHIVVPLVRRAGADWIVRAELLEPDGGEPAVEAQTDNAITAAGDVADRLLDLLGKRAPGEVMNAARLSQTELLQRVDAARLAGDPARARALIAAADPALQRAPEVQLRLAQIDLRTGEFEAARDRLASLVDEVSEENDALLHARLQSYLCIALARTDRMDAATGACDKAIALLETRDQPDELGRVYSDRGIIRTLQQKYDLAAKDFARARIALTLAGDALLLAKVDGNESILQTAQGRYVEAIAIQQRIGERFERFGMNNELVASLNNQTGAHLALLQPLDALKTSDRALALIDRVTDASIRYFTKLQRADALELNGRLGQARVLLDEVIDETGAAQYAPERAVARASEARLDLAAGRAADALLLAKQAIPALPSPPYSDVRAAAWLSDVRALHALGRTEEAAAEWQAFAAWADTVAEPVVTLYARLAEAELRVGQQRMDAARPIYEDALAIAQRWGVPNALRETAGSYGRFLIAQGDLAQAGVVVGLVSRYADVDFDAALLQARLYRALGREDAAQRALSAARGLAGDRLIPTDLLTPPRPLRNGIPGDDRQLRLQSARRSDRDSVVSPQSARRSRT